MNEKIVIELKKGEVVQLNNLMSILKIGSIDTDCSFALLDTKIELSSVIKEINEAGRLAQENLNPEGTTDKNIYERKYIEYMNRFLDESVQVKIRKISRENMALLSKDNNLTIQEMQMLNLLCETISG